MYYDLRSLRLCEESHSSIRTSLFFRVVRVFRGENLIRNDPPVLSLPKGANLRFPPAVKTLRSLRLCEESHSSIRTSLFFRVVRGENSLCVSVLLSVHSLFP